MIRQTIKTCLCFDGNAEEAARFYVSVFRDLGDCAVTGVAPGPGSAARAVAFRLAGVEFLALNGGPRYRFDGAISLLIDCRSREELDELRKKLSAGGSRGRCGWLKDRYGLSWQVVPAALPQLLGAGRLARRAAEAVTGMRTLDIRALEAVAGAA
jgi:predicted 3-demethylubiquinone-9 3-methyltransferase (glyoxalase superfamily)